jgi:hypothetical protein
LDITQIGSVRFLWLAPFLSVTAAVVPAVAQETGSPHRNQFVFGLGVAGARESVESQAFSQKGPSLSLGLLHGDPSRWFRIQGGLTFTTINFIYGRTRTFDLMLGGVATPLPLARISPYLGAGVGPYINSYDCSGVVTLQEGRRSYCHHPIGGFGWQGTAGLRARVEDADLFLEARYAGQPRVVNHAALLIGAILH